MATAPKKDSGLLKGVKEICEFLRVTERDFYMFLRLGLPVRQINGRWFAHENNIIIWAQKITVGKPITDVAENNVNPF